jgi:hypothetical protein
VVDHGLENGAQDVSHDFMEISMARALKCVSISRGNFDEWSNVDVRNDARERKQS